MRCYLLTLSAILIFCSGCVSSIDTVPDEKAEDPLSAKIIATRETQKNPTDFDAYNKVIDASLTLAREELAKGDVTKSGKGIESAEFALHQMKTLAMKPEVKLRKDFAIIISSQEKAVAEISEELTRFADEKAKDLLDKADEFERRASNIFIKNNRNEVVRGLMYVRRCNEMGRWVSLDTRSRSNNSLRKLLRLVNEDEKSMILRSAGFE